MPEAPASDSHATDRQAAAAQQRRLREAQHVHLVGINGTGMSSLAGLLLAMGKRVTGSDLAPGAAAANLQRRGATIYRGHRAEQVGEADLVIASSAVPQDNAELVEARRRGLRVIKHAQALGELMLARYGIAVAGTHGKSTTTALTAFLLDRAGLQPTLVGGAESIDFDGSSRLGEGVVVVVEADEYDRRFLELQPRLAIVTSIEPDHLDYYADLDEIVGAFAAFLDRLPEDGIAIVCEDDERVRRLPIRCQRYTYGFASDADYAIASYSARPGQGVRFSLRAPDGAIRDFQLGLVGRHNASNAAAALAAARSLDIPWDTLAAALPCFRGTRRRFEHVGSAGGLTIVDDYAHHPTAIRATLRAARDWHEGPLWVVFQPHTTNRTAALLDEFAAALRLADRVYLLPIYQPAGRETQRRAVTSTDLATRVGHDVVLCDSLEDAARRIAAVAPAGTLVLTMGAGDVTALGPMLLELLSQRSQ